VNVGYRFRGDVFGDRRVDDVFIDADVRVGVCVDVIESELRRTEDFVFELFPGTDVIKPFSFVTGETGG
jgi:hypothetical protein